MGQFINEDARRMKELSDNFDQLGPEMLLGVAPDDVTEEDTATANIIRIEYMNKGKYRWKSWLSERHMYV